VKFPHTEKWSACQSDLRFAILCSGQTGCWLEVFSFSTFFYATFFQDFMKQFTFLEKNVYLLNTLSLLMHVFEWFQSFFLVRVTLKIFTNDIFQDKFLSLPRFRSLPLSLSLSFSVHYHLPFRPSFLFFVISFPWLLWSSSSFSVAISFTFFVPLLPLLL
jgi:hypothetical protein